jgi:hypothetical protein
MKATMLLVLLTISTAQAAEPRGTLPEPKGTLTLACKGTKSETTPRIADEDQSSVSVDIIIDFGARTVAGFPLPPICNLDQPVIKDITGTTIFFTGCNPSDLTVSYSFLGTFDRRTGAVEADFKSTGDVTWTRSFSLKCKPTR